jgi:hypothetical protein
MQCNTIQDRSKAQSCADDFQFSVATCKPSLIATKIICADGKEIPFGNAKQFQFHYRELGTLGDFAEALRNKAGKQHAI